jgi:AraC-like DNA-binding protein
MSKPYLPSRENSKFWRATDYHNLELLSATYITHKFSHHFHETYAVGVIERGAYQFYHRGSKERISQGQVLLINPTEVHGGEPIDNVGWKYRMLYPSISLMQKIAHEITGEDWTPPHFSKPIIEDPIVARQLLHLHHVLEQSDNRLKRDTAMRIALGSLILRHAENNPIDCCISSERDAVRRVREYLETYYEANTALDELADIAGLSPFHLVRVFKNQTGLPPHNYLTHVRILRAREMLQNNPLSIADVAYATGFTDQSHLTRWFKRIVGVTPGKYATV